MKNAKLLLSVLCFLLSVNAVMAQDWQVLKGEHFLVYYSTDYTDKKFAEDVLKKAEGYYDKIASDLGYSRYDKFWQWENRVKIYIYSTRDEFMQATGIEEWVGGLAKYKEKEIISYRWSEGFLDSLLPHELAHLIFRDFVGFPAKDGPASGGEGIPLWLDEGVAQWEEEFKKREAIETVKKIIKEENFIPIAELTQMEIRGEKDFDLVRKFYAQAITLVGYLIEEYGGSSFTLFCRQLRDGKNIDKALSFVYTNSIGSVEELERKWMEYYYGGIENGKI